MSWCRTAAICLLAWPLAISNNAFAIDEGRAKSLQQEVSALKVQVAELQQIVSLLQHHLSAGSKKEELESDPGLTVSAADTACTKLVERLRTKLHAMKAYGYTERHPDVRQLTTHLDGMSRECSENID